MRDYRKLITGHCIAHWRVPHKFHVRHSSILGELAIMEFRPDVGHCTAILVTNGMSNTGQRHSRGEYRCEVFAQIASDVELCANLLGDVAEYPFLHGTSLSTLDTIAIARSAAFPWSALMVVPPPPEFETVGVLVTPEGESVLFNEVVAITDKELDYSLDQGNDKLWQVLGKRRSKLSFNGSRLSFV